MFCWKFDGVLQLSGKIRKEHLDAVIPTNAPMIFVALFSCSRALSESSAQKGTDDTTERCFTVVVFSKDSASTMLQRVTPLKI